MNSYILSTRYWPNVDLNARVVPRRVTSAGCLDSVQKLRIRGQISHLLSSQLFQQYSYRFNQQLKESRHRRTPVMNSISTPIADLLPAQLPLSSPEQRQLLNSKAAPILQLNYDILGRIFLLNTRLDFQHPHSPSHTTRRSSQVCHVWRKFALEYPMLWGACIDFADPLRWIKECISRSGSVPFPDLIIPSLTTHLLSKEYGMFMRTSVQNARYSIAELIYLLASTTIDDERIKLGASLFQRPRRIFLKIKKDKWKQVVANLVQPSPNLASFSLNLQGSQEDSVDYVLPDDLFAGHAPHLRVLELRGCGCNFHSPIFQDLTTLVVRKPSSRKLPSVESWLAIVGHMTKLQTLELNRCFSEGGLVDRGRQLPDVHLPQLESLTLVGDISLCGPIFTHLQFPSTCIMSVKCYHARLDDDFTLMIPLVQSRVEAMDTPSGRTCISVQSSTTGLGFNKRHADPARSNDLICSFDWFARYSGESIMHILPSVLPVLKAAAVDVRDLRLDFNSSKELTNAPAGALLGAFGEVEHLSMVMSDTVSRVLSVMNSAHKAHQPPPLPALRSIAMEHIIFGDSAPSHDRLIDFVRRRPEIKSVNFINCTPVVAAIEELVSMGVDAVDSSRRKIVPDV